MSLGRFFASLTTKAHRAQLCQLSKRQISANKTFFPGKKKRTATFPDRYVPETLEVFRHRLEITADYHLQQDKKRDATQNVLEEKSSPASEGAFLWPIC
jgi:hypothetical protein